MVYPNALLGTTAIGTTWMPLLGTNSVLSGYGATAQPVTMGYAQQGFRFTVGNNKADDARTILRNSGAMSVNS
jgi:hypothetical protein